MTATAILPSRGHSTSSRQEEHISTLHRFTFALAFLFRFVTYAVALGILHDTFAISTSQESLTLALLFSQVAATILSFSRLRSWVPPVGILLLFGAANLLFRLLQSFFTNTAAGILEPYSLLLDINLLVFTAFFGYITTWAYWRVRFYATLEILATLFLLLTFFAPHRDFQLALAPKVVHTLAWELNTSSFALIIIMGSIVTLLTSIYLGLASHAGLPTRGKGHATQDILVAGKSRPLLGTILTGLIVLIVSLISRQVYSHYQQIQESVGANGVGFKETEESIGKSPLGFHSALGSNNQPSAVVRLGGDYQENPTSPMLFLREGALSAFNGKELVNAGKGFDDDIPGTSAQEVFQTEERLELDERVPVPQSVYLLTDHDVVFTIDYPVSVQPLENPAPQRFRGAYQAYSVAPSYHLSDLLDRTPGNPNWTELVRDHYLAQHTDKRYADFAARIVGEETNPAARASMLSNFLTKNAIYTLTPNHEVKPNEDPVAPFLFGDLRGYCVHFAHAVTYMLRSLGIPARIATGYLTDLSQARDGHILLRMSDRHAWAEAYFEGYGWVPFDVQPEQVESHADSEVDSQLLEELMGLIGPEKTLIPEESFVEEPGLKEPPSWSLPSTVALLKIAFVMLIVFYLWKLVLWYGWLLPGDGEAKIKRAYVAIYARLLDLGYSRKFAETVQEFHQRVKSSYGLNPENSWEILRHLKYGAVTGSPDELQSAMRDDFSELAKIHLVRRFLAFFNPVSVFRLR
ncbi:MAG: transglutaminase domain-containing protein [Bdellovibrionales bacterium]|nr:transglutaminase domain-containing protein [Bdellovibrionales bacterium]